MKKWIEGGIKTGQTKDNEILTKEKELYRIVENLFKSDSRLSEELEAKCDEHDGYIFYYPCIDIKAVKK